MEKKFWDLLDRGNIFPQNGLFSDHGGNSDEGKNQSMRLKSLCV
jgi:hypothetical protein